MLHNKAFKKRNIKASTGTKNDHCELLASDSSGSAIVQLRGEGADKISNAASLINQ